MTKEQIETLMQAATIAASAVSPVGGLVGDLVGLAAREAAILFHAGEMTAEELADIKARGNVADDAWDAIVAAAKPSSSQSV